jgi:hypothetical protein
MKLIKLKSVTILEDRLRVCENDISVLDFITCQLLDNLVGDNNSITNIVVDFCEEKIFCLSAAKCQREAITEEDNIHLVQSYQNLIRQSPVSIRGWHCPL